MITIKGRTIFSTSISSLTFRDDIKSILSAIEDEKEQPRARLDSASYLLGKGLQMYYKVPKNKYNTLTKNISDTIIKTDNYIDERYKLIQTHFVYDEINYDISKILYDEYKSNRMTMEEFTYICIVKVLIKYTRDNNFRERLYDELHEMYRLTTELQKKMRIADVFYLSDNIGRNAQGRAMLQEIRDQEEKEIEERKRNIIFDDRVHYNNNHNNNPNDKKINNVYNDSQNVHNTTINDNVKKVAFDLIQKMQVYSFDYDKVSRDLINHMRTKLSFFDKIKNTFTSDLSGKEQIINKVLHRFQYETSYFDNFNLSQLFSSIYAYIEEHKHRDEMKSRLIEEMIEMNGHCTTGHLARLANCIQGFCEDSLQIKIPSFDQISTVIYNYLNKQIQNAPDEVQDSMIDENNKRPFLQYICDIMNINKDKFDKEYNREDIDKYLIDILNKFTNTRMFNLNKEENLVTIL